MRKVHFACFPGRERLDADGQRTYGQSPWPSLECSLPVSAPLASQDIALVTCGTCLRYRRIRRIHGRPGPWGPDPIAELRLRVIEEPDPYNPGETWCHTEYELMLTPAQLAEGMWARQEVIEAALA